MPSPSQKPPEFTSEPPSMMREMVRNMTRPHDPVAAELAALREEITALRRDLAPPSAVILTGKPALDLFAQLKRH